MIDIMNIFDIDGCIIPSCFPNLSEPQNRGQLIKDVLEKSKKIELFPIFIDYYQAYCEESFSIFITGRQKSEFKELTEKQLRPLEKINNNFFIIYYPENKSYNPEEYFTWKTNSIKLFINNENTKYLIFDDLDDYFEDLRKYRIGKNIFLYFYKINSNDGWLELIL